MRIANYAYLLLALTVYITLTGCKKVYDYVENHPDATIKSSLIKKISYASAYQTDTLVFTYNKWGNPEKVTRPYPATGAPNFLFRYDASGRLTDYIGVYYDGRTTEFWHKYYYDPLGRITTDSVFIFSVIENGVPTNPYYRYVYTLSYDSKDRIVEEIRSYPPYEPTVIQYSYDANGNRTGGIYDHKVNYHRTNKIWMFIDRDYSLNNPFTADQYNYFGLPEKINLDNKTGSQSFLGNYFTKAVIEYEYR